MSRWTIPPCPLLATQRRSIFSAIVRDISSHYLLGVLVHDGQYVMLALTYAYNVHGILHTS